ncbi:chromate transporter [Pseudoduganella eburnea]|uniref:Chromate transporter n=1 Tax=Massilia eburnea TaxID=1776165 RepID=A0A6L6QGW7_9BURK|nr:chromate transporter [Massilia eburnea]MTW10893.1 chromate transporter [Massilia eburnea]
MQEARVGCWALFKVFSHMALQGFGGVLPFAYRHLVERTKWLTASEFSQLLSIAQLLPGPTICNLAVMVGQRYAGVAGGLSALAGMLIAPFFIVIAMGVAYQGLVHHPIFVNAMRGMSAAASGLILATALKLALGMLRSPAPEQAVVPAAEGSANAEALDVARTVFWRRVVQVALLVAAFIGLGVAKVGLITVVATLVPIGFLLFAFVWRKP